MADQQRLDILVEAIDNASKTLTEIAVKLDVLTEKRKRDEQAQQDAANASGGILGAYQQFRGVLTDVNQALELAGKAWRTVVSAISPAITAALEQEAITTRLAVSLANMGGRAQDSVADLGATADALTRLTGVSDETIGEVQNLLISLGRLGGAELERATRATLDFSISTGVDAVTAARQLSAVLSGEVNSLGRVQLGIDETVKGSERLSTVLGIMEGRWRDNAEAIGGTFTGRVNAAAEAYETLLEAIGETIIQSPEVIALIDGLSRVFDHLAAAVRSVNFREFVSLAAADIAALTESVARLGQGAAALSGILSALGQGPDLSGLASVFDEIADAAEATRKRIEDLRSSAVVLASLEVIPPAERADATIAKIQALRAELGLVSTATAELTAKAHELRTLELIPDSDKTLDTKARIKALREEVLAVAPAAQAAADGLGGFDDEALKLKRTLDQLGPAFTDLIDVGDVAGARAALQALVVDLRKIGDTEKLKLLADLDVKIPDIAKAAEAGLAGVNADVLVKVFADAGDQASLALLASMKAKLPEIADAAELALSTIRIDAAVKDIDIPALGFKIDVGEINEAAAVLQGISAFQQEIVRLQGEAVVGTANFNKALFGAVEETGSLAAAWQKVGAQVVEATVAAAQKDAIAAQGELLLGADGFRILMLQAAAATDSQAEAWERVADQIGALDLNDINEELVRSIGEAVLGVEQFNAMLLQAWEATGSMSGAWAVVAEQVAVANEAAAQHQANLELIAAVQQALINGALRLGDTIVDAAFGADVSWRKFFKQFMADIAKAIVQALILKAISSATGVGLFGFSQGGQVPDTAAMHPAGFAAQGGQIQNAPPPLPRVLAVPGFATGGQIAGTRTTRDSVLIAAQPGEIILRNDVTKFAEEAVLSQATRGGQSPGFTFNMRFENMITRNLVEELMREITDVVESKGGVLKASHVVS
jgi:hypothetical protein